jgi:hypothetical protein
VRIQIHSGAAALIASTTLAGCAVLASALLGSGWRWISPSTYEAVLRLLDLLPSGQQMHALQAQQGYVSLLQAKLLTTDAPMSFIRSAGLFGAADWVAAAMVWTAVGIGACAARRAHREAAEEDRAFRRAVARGRL